MLDQSWLNEAFGSYPELPNSIDEGRASTISFVVQGFLANEAEFSSDDVTRYVNEALQNDAGDLWQERSEGREVADAWQSRADQALLDLDPAGAADASQKHDAMLQAMSDGYDLGRSGFADALRTVQRAKNVALTPETRSWVIKLDDDKYLTQTMGVDVDVLFADSRLGRALPSGRKAPRLVDFSREVPPEASGTTAEVAWTLESREEVPMVAARAQRVLAEGPARGRPTPSANQYRPAEAGNAMSPVAEPEVA